MIVSLEVLALLGIVPGFSEKQQACQEVRQIAREGT